MRRLVASLALGASLVACAPGERPNVVLVFVDTLRADRLSLYGGPRPTSPRLDAAAERGAVFEDALAPSPWTLPSAASMLSGLHPNRHGAGLHGEVRNLDRMLPTRMVEGVESLPVWLERAGYRTAAIASNPHLRSGLLQEFDDWTCRVTEGSVVVRQAIDRLDDLAADAPFLLMVHFMDTHDPLLAPEEHTTAVTEEDDEVRVLPAFSRHFALRRLTNKLFYRQARMLAYDASIHYVDAQLDRLLRALEARDLDDDTVVAFTSDHGEEVFDHLKQQTDLGYEDPRDLYGLGHGHALFVEQLSVPLVLWGPGIRAGRIPDQVSLMDLAPTLLDYAGVASPGGLDGRSLRPLIEGRALEPRPLLAGSIAYGSDRRAWITPEWKLIVGGAEGEVPMLFDRVADPTEQNNLLRTRPELVRELQAALVAAEESLGRVRGDETAPSAQDELDLRALGYAGLEEEPPPVPEAGVAPVVPSTSDAPGGSGG